MIKGNEPAQPHIKSLYHQGGAVEILTDFLSGGLTIREHFASMAMQGFISNEPDRKPENYASDAVACADALITALNTTERESK